MKRRKFIKTAAFGTIGAGVFPSNLLFARDCDITGDDILGPYWSEGHPSRSILANSDEPGSRIFISGRVTANDCETPIQNALVDVGMQIMMVVILYFKSVIQATQMMMYII